MKKRKVLMISYLWPPMEGVGLIRVFQFAKYLPECGWEPVILTVRHQGEDCKDNVLKGVKVIRTGYKDVIKDTKDVLGMLRVWGRKDKINLSPAMQERANRGGNRLISLIREFIAMPDEQIGWHGLAVEAGKKIIEEEGVDLIFSTSPPETAHLIARALKRHCALPWVADLRDLWSKDHFRERPFLKKAALHLMEKNILKDADSLVTISGPWAKELKDSLGSSRVEVIENGFDDEDFKDAGYRGNEKFTICYTGKLHRDHQPTEVFFKALRSLVDEGRMDRVRVEARFYILGYDRPDISGMASRYGLADIVKEFGRVGYERALEIQRSSEVLLFVQWKGRGSDGWYSAKLYDYLGARRPILALAEGGGIIDRFLRQTSAGILVESEEELKAALARAYAEYESKGYVSYNGNEDEILKHTRKIRTKGLAELFNSLIDQRRRI